MEANQVMPLPADCSTRDVARVLGMAVRSVQLMVDRGELEAWKTPGGHRRIARTSVERWLRQRHGSSVVVPGEASPSQAAVVALDVAARGAPRQWGLARARRARSASACC